MISENAPKVLPSSAFMDQFVPLITAAFVVGVMVIIDGYVVTGGHSFVEYRYAIHAMRGIPTISPVAMAVMGRSGSLLVIVCLRRNYCDGRAQ